MLIFSILSQELITDTDAMLLVLSKVLFSLLLYLTQLFLSDSLMNQLK